MSTNLQAVNEPVRSYESGSDDRKNLQIKYDQMASEVVEIPLIIGGKGVKTGEQVNASCLIIINMFWEIFTWLEKMK